MRGKWELGERDNTKDCQKDDAFGDENEQDAELQKYKRHY